MKIEINTSKPFTDHREACLAILNSNCKITRKAGQFLGGEVVYGKPLSEAQCKWLNEILEHAKLPKYIGKQ